jgi:hypothetical protein
LEKTVSDPPQERRISAEPLGDRVEAPLPAEPGPSYDNPSLNLMVRMVKFFLWACFIGGLLPVLAVVVAAVFDPNGFVYGGGMYPRNIGGTVLLVSVAAGIVGLLVGAVIGVIGAVVIAIRG